MAGRLPRRAGRLLGDVLINGQPRSRGFRSITAYVLQDDVLYGTLTVRETFEFAAAIRLPAAVSKATRTQLVDGEDLATELVHGLTCLRFPFPGPCLRRVLAAGHCQLKPCCTMLSSPRPDTALLLPPVTDIISELALGKAADTFIGNAFMRGVSGEAACNVCAAVFGQAAQCV